MLPDLPNLKRDIQKVMDRYLHIQVKSRMGIFGEVPRQIIQEGNRMRMVRADGSVDESEFKRASAEISLKFEEIPTLTVEERVTKLNDMAEQMASQMSKQLFGTLNEIMEKTGRTTDGKGKPLDAEAVLSALESIDVEFDESGRINGLSLVVPPALEPKAKEAMEALNFDPMLKKRHEDIMLKKWTEWRDREDSRKLVG